MHVIHALERPDLVALMGRVDVADVAAADVDRAVTAVIRPKELAGGGIVDVFEERVGIALLHAVAPHLLAVLCIREGRHMPAVAVDDVLDLVAQRAVTIEGIAHVQDLVLAVIVHVLDTELVRLRTAHGLGVVLPELLELGAARIAVGDHEGVEALVGIAVLDPADERRVDTVEIPDLHHARHRADAHVVLRQVDGGLERAGHAVDDGDGLAVAAGAVGEGLAVPERHAVCGAQEDVRGAVHVHIIDGRPVPHAHVDGGGAGGDVVLVLAVHAEVDRPEVGAVMEIRLELLVLVRAAVDEVVVPAVAVEVADPDEMDRAARMDRDDLRGAVVALREDRRAGLQRKVAIRGRLDAVVDGRDVVGIVLPEVGGGVGEVGAAEEGGIIQLDGLAAGGAVDVEADVRLILREQAPAHEDRAPGADGIRPAVELLDITPGGERLLAVIGGCGGGRRVDGAGREAVDHAVQIVPQEPDVRVIHLPVGTGVEDGLLEVGERVRRGETALHEPEVEDIERPGAVEVGVVIGLRLCRRREGRERCQAEQDGCRRRGQASGRSFHTYHPCPCFRHAIPNIRCWDGAFLSICDHYTRMALSIQWQI